MSSNSRTSMIRFTLVKIALHNNEPPKSGPPFVAHISAALSGDCKKDRPKSVAF